MLGNFPTNIQANVVKEADLDIGCGRSVRPKAIISLLAFGTDDDVSGNDCAI
jgi:hypothetical protein